MPRDPRTCTPPARRAGRGAVCALLALAAGRPQAGQVKDVVTRIRAEQGYCYTAPVQPPCAPDTPGGAASQLRLFEDERELGPPHAMHQDVRDSGRGAFSHWSGTADGKVQTLYFSASDNSNPRTNGRTYRWEVTLDEHAKPVARDAMREPPRPCRLRTVTTEPLRRDHHTMLLAHFDASDHNDADYARTLGSDVGTGASPEAPGRFGGGVSVHGSDGAVRFPGLDNYDPTTGTAEFWVRSAAEQTVWTDDRLHWLFVLYPEHAGASDRYGQSPIFIALCKTPLNTLALRVVNTHAAPYNAAARLADPAQGWSLSIPTDHLDPDAWHHLLLSWDLRGSGRGWLMVDGQGVTGDIGLPAWSREPNRGIFVVLGGFWGLPGDDVRTSDCALDDLRIQDCTVERRLEEAEPVREQDIDAQRLLTEMDLARATLDKLISLQSRGGWAASYNWPTYTPGGWSLVGRGVDMWFVNSAWAGNALMRGWMIWGDDRYLEAAIEAADMFCRTQMANGTWAYHYTFGRGELLPWQRSAYIAQSMQSNQIRFLCLMYKRLGYKRYEKAIKNAGDWMTSSQFPSGAWGWEGYPADKEGPHGHPALNDSVTPQAMWDLFIIHLATGDDRYLRPVSKGAQWIVDAQAGPPTHGWADQYDADNNFVWMRNFEPPAVSMQAISAATWGLCLAYDITGDETYLGPLRKVLTWMDTVPEDQRGWLWYDPTTSVPVVAYHNEMLPVTHKKAVEEIIPRLSAHYGVKFAWQADRIRRELAARKDGPVYPDWRGSRSCSAFAQAPAVEEFASVFRADHAAMARERLAGWLAGEPAPGLIESSSHYGRTFNIQNAIGYCEQLLSDIECARVALADLPADAIPRYARGGSRNWVYMAPTRHYFAGP